MNIPCIHGDEDFVTMYTSANGNVVISVFEDGSYSEVVVQLSDLLDLVDYVTNSVD